MLSDYLKIDNQELKEITFFSMVLSLMFSFTYIRFNIKSDFFSIFFLFFLFLLVLFMLKLYFMKFIAYKNHYSINLRMSYFDRYWFREYDRVSYDFKGLKGIPMPFVSLILYILTLGILIVPIFWRYKYKIIPHRHIGTKLKYESDLFEGVSNYRISKVFFSGYLFYVFFLFMLKFFSSSLGEFFYWFSFMILWIAFFNLIPIIGTNGWDFFSRGRFGWVCAINVLVLTMISIFVFESILYVIGMSLITFFIVLVLILWRQLV